MSNTTPDTEQSDKEWHELEFAISLALDIGDEGNPNINEDRTNKIMRLIDTYCKQQVEKMQSALDDERKKFQQETLRSSKPLKPLFEMTRVFAADGHDGWHPRCARCEVYRQAVEALKDTVYYAELNQSKEL